MTFDLYGSAALLLIAAVFGGGMLWRYLRRTGRRAWPALVLALPLALGAIVHIAFWLAFFSDPGLAVPLGIVRAEFWSFVSAWRSVIGSVIGLLAAALLVAALKPRPRPRAT